MQGNGDGLGDCEDSFSLQQSFQFTVKLQKGDEERRRIEIKGDPLMDIAQTGDYAFSHSTVWEMGKPIRKTAVYCTSRYFNRAVQIYMNFFVSAFFLNHIQLVRLGPYFLSEFRDTVNNVCPNLNWDFRSIEWFPLGTVLSEEERYLLEYCKNPHAPPSNFKLPPDFWELPAIRDSAQLILDDDRNQPLEDGYSPGVYGLVVDVCLGRLHSGIY